MNDIDDGSTHITSPKPNLTIAASSPYAWSTSTSNTNIIAIHQKEPTNLSINTGGVLSCAVNIKPDGTVEIDWKLVDEYLSSKKKDNPIWNILLALVAVRDNTWKPLNET